MFFLTEGCIVMVKIKELIGTTGYLMLQTKFCKNRCRYNRIQLYLFVCIYVLIYL